MNEDTTTVRGNVKSVAEMLSAVTGALEQVVCVFVCMRMRARTYTGVEFFERDS